MFLYLIEHDHRLHQSNKNIAPHKIDKHSDALQTAAIGIPDTHYCQGITTSVALKPGTEGSMAAGFSNQEAGLCLRTGNRNILACVSPSICGGG